jgi:hypothetical protein
MQRRYGRYMGDEDFWTIGTTAMTEEEARVAVHWIAERFPSVHPSVVDPRLFRTVSMDRGTVEMMSAALALYASHGGDVGGMLAEFEEWLRATAPK